MTYTISENKNVFLKPDQGKARLTISPDTESVKQRPQISQKRKKLNTGSVVDLLTESSIPEEKSLTVSSRENGPVDHLDTFGRYVAEELRNVEDTFSVQVAKHRINQILFDATTGLFRRPQ